MQRPLKFRQWDTLMKRMVPFKEKDDVEITKDGTLQCYMPKNILLQWTGLKDKNGKEIYEGDIVRSGNGRVWQIKFGAYEHQELRQVSTHDGWHLEGDGNTVLIGTPTALEIIGNIYENPELLTNQQAA